MNIAAMTHRGAVRSENQDALCVAKRIWTEDMSAPQILKMEELRMEELQMEEFQMKELPLLLAVVDGMGGHKGGGRAARILAEVLSGAVFEAKLDLEADEGVLNSLLQEAALRMESEARQAPDLADMGATVSGAVIREKNALVFNCGDCRVYRFSSGGLERLTRDHSIVQILYEQGEIDEDEMRLHPQKNIVTSAVSADPTVMWELYVKGVSRWENDVFFLCSDGVWEAMDSRQLARWLTPGLPLAQGAAGLFDALLAGGCRDNVSFLWQVG
jgi:serine/threonine protein phosphatase PrpC